MSSGAIAAQPEKILRALGQVWTSLGEEERHQGRPTVLRACAMTLVVVTDEQDQASGDAAQTLVELMHAHPSRAIVVKSDGGAENGLSARVFAQCWKPFGKAQQICCEQIEVSVQPDRWPDVGPTLLGIIVPDLPVVVWSRQQRLLGTPGSAASSLDSILPLATKVIVDTEGADRKQAFESFKGWREQGRVFGDLAWTRLTAWRETLATVFDEHPELLGRGKIRSAKIGYSGAAAPTGVCYLAGWLEHGLGIRPAIEEVSVPRDAGVPEGPVSVALSGEKEIALRRTGPTCLEVALGDQVQRVSLGGNTLYELMHEELTVLGVDAQFDAAFDRAGGFAS